MVREGGNAVADSEVWWERCGREHTSDGGEGALACSGRRCQHFMRFSEANKGAVAVGTRDLRNFSRCTIRLGMHT
jgi:hypothetical protein